MGKFLCEGRGELGASVRDYLVVEAESREDMLKKDLSNVHSRGSFVARAENYPLRKTMVYHNQNRIMATGDGEVCDEVHGNLLERAGALGGGRHKRWVGGMSVHLIGLAHGTASDEFADKCGHFWPPIVLLEKRNGMEVPAVSASEGFMETFYEGVSGGFRDIEAGLVIECALVEVPVLRGGLGEWDHGGIYGSKCINDELVRRGGISDF